MIGTITANSLAEQIELAAYCSLEGYKKEQAIPAVLTGNPTARGNKGQVFKGQDNVEFQASCSFPPEAATGEKARNAKTAKLIVTYEFVTKATQKVYFLNKRTLLGLGSQDPFKAYQISDPQLYSRKIKSL